MNTMISIKPNAEMHAIFKKTIQVMGARVEWNGIFLVHKNSIIMPGKLKSLIFSLDSKKIVGTVVELHEVKKDEIYTVKDKIIENAFNMLLYIFGKWGQIKGLTVEKNYNQLEEMIRSVLTEIDVDTEFTKDKCVFIRDSVQISYEDVIESFITLLEPEKVDELIEDDQTEQNDEKATEDECDREQKQSDLERENWFTRKYKIGLWHKIVWKSTNQNFKKHNIPTGRSKKDRLGKDYYLSNYKCPECNSFLHMVVYPVSNEFLIDTDEGEVMLARMYTCHKCTRFYTPRPRTMLIEGAAYVMDFEGDQTAYEDYLELTGETGARTSNCNFNEYLRVIEANEQNIGKNSKNLRQSDIKDEELEELENVLETPEKMSDQELITMKEQMDSYYYPSSIANQFDENVCEVLSQRGMKQVSTDAKIVKKMKKIRAFQVNPSNVIKEMTSKYKSTGGKKNQTNSHRKTDDHKQVNKKQIQDKQTQEKQAQVKEKQVQEKQVQEKQIQEKQAQEKQVQVKEKQIQEMKIQEKHSKERQVQEEQVQKKQIQEKHSQVKQVQEQQAKGKQAQEIQPQEKQLKNKMNQDIQLNEKQNQKQNQKQQSQEQHNQETQWQETQTLDSNSSYADMRKQYTKLKQQDLPEGEKKGLLDHLLTSMEERGLKELSVIESHIPDHISRKQFLLLKDQIEQYQEAVSDSKVNQVLDQLHQKRDEQENKEIADFILKTNKRPNDRNSLMQVYENLLEQDFEDENKRPFLAKIMDKIKGIDQTFIKRLCPDLSKMSFREGKDAVVKIENADILPELKDDTLARIDRRLNLLKRDECEELVDKFKREFNWNKTDYPGISLYHIKHMNTDVEQEQEQEQGKDRDANLFAHAIDEIVGELDRYEYPLFYCDMSRNQTGKSGFIVTPDHLYYRFLMNRGVLEMSHIKEIYSYNNLINKGIYVDYEKVGKLKIAGLLKETQMNTGKSEEFLGKLNEFVSYLQEKPESREIDYMAKESHTVKCCYRCGFMFKEGNLCPRCGAQNQ